MFSLAVGLMFPQFSLQSSQEEIRVLSTSLKDEFGELMENKLRGIFDDRDDKVAGLEAAVARLTRVSRLCLSGESQRLHGHYCRRKPSWKTLLPRARLRQRLACLRIVSTSCCSKAQLSTTTLSVLLWRRGW